jgi:hypothetical protein
MMVYLVRYPAQLKGFATMNNHDNPASVAAPFDPYSHAVNAPRRRLPNRQECPIKTNRMIGKERHIKQQAAIL